MYKTILAPLDASKFCEEALSASVSVARRARAELCLATVEIASAFFPESYNEAVARSAAGAYLERIATDVHEASGLEAKTEVVTGEVAEALERLRETVGADLVVMATHGRGPLSRAWLGSTTDALLRTTEVPLLLVRPKGDNGEIDLGEGVDFARILITSDGSPTSEAILEPTIALGKLFGASYHVIRVVEYPRSVPSAYLPDIAEENRKYLETATAIAERETHDLVERLRAKDLNVEGSTVVSAHVPEGILATATEGDFDLIAVATHGRGGVRRMVLGSVADKVIRGTDLPVLTVRPSE